MLKKPETSQGTLIPSNNFLDHSKGLWWLAYQPLPRFQRILQVKHTSPNSITTKLCDAI